LPDDCRAAQDGIGKNAIIMALQGSHAQKMAEIRHFLPRNPAKIAEISQTMSKMG